MVGVHLRLTICFVNTAGNKWFRDAVSGSMEEYMKADNRFEKSLVVHSIMDNVKKQGGRFLKKDYSAGKWVELNEPQAKEKVGHAVRDAVNAAFCIPMVLGIVFIVALMPLHHHCNRFHMRCDQLTLRDQR